MFWNWWAGFAPHQSLNSLPDPLADRSDQRASQHDLNLTLAHGVFGQIGVILRLVDHLKPSPPLDSPAHIHDAQHIVAIDAFPVIRVLKGQRQNSEVD